MRFVMPLVGIIIAAAISLVAGMCWQWFLPGSGKLVAAGAFIVLALATIASRHE